MTILLVMLLKVFSAYVLAAASCCVALMATLVSKYPKLLHSCVLVFLNGSTLEELPCKLE